MTTVKQLAQWLNRGRQKKAVGLVLRLPMTESQIVTAAKAHAPKIQLRDVWYILGQMQDRHLVRCLNPQDRNGKCYCYTALGGEVARHAFVLEAGDAARNLNWSAYGKVVRAKTRQRVLLAIASSLENRPKTAKNRRKKLCERSPLGRNGLLRALHELERQGAIVSGIDPSSNRKIYRTTIRGQRIIQMLTAVRRDHDPAGLGDMDW